MQTTLHNRAYSRLTTVLLVAMILSMVTMPMPMHAIVALPASGLGLVDSPRLDGISTRLMLLRQARNLKRGCTVSPFYKAKQGAPGIMSEAVVSRHGQLGGPVEPCRKASRRRRKWMGAFFSSPLCGRGPLRQSLKEVRGFSRPSLSRRMPASGGQRGAIISVSSRPSRPAAG